MKNLIRVVLAAIVVVASYVAGSWRGPYSAQSRSVTVENEILYYECPMHPSFKSDKPGAAPCCGMQLEPVYKEGRHASGDLAELLPGAVHISADRQQLLGVITNRVEKTGGVKTLRIPGRVSADESRVYKIKASESGWIREVYSSTVGSLVQKNQRLAAFYATPALQGAQLTYINTLNLVAQNPVSNGELPGQAVPAENRIQAAADALRNLGVSDAQIAELGRTRKPMKDVLICAPATGLLAARDVSAGQRFQAGDELYRIIDLSRVWILADLFENEARHFRPGLTARIFHPYLGRTFSARVSEVLPQFDAATRTLKVRLEADNPGFMMQPDMFVDVELPVSQPPALNVPAEAVLDTGRTKTVFVAHENGVFEPREIRTGWRSSGRIEITGGLSEGENIVVSGNFLIDSESRLKKAAASFQSKPVLSKNSTVAQKVLDPVCGMLIEVGAGTARSDLEGKTNFFCSIGCKRAFDDNPAKYSGSNPRKVRADRNTREDISYPGASAFNRGS